MSNIEAAPKLIDAYAICEKLDSTEPVTIDEQQVYRAIMSNANLCKATSKLITNDANNDPVESVKLIANVVTAIKEVSLPIYASALVVNALGSLSRRAMEHTTVGIYNCKSFVCENMFAQNAERTAFFRSLMLSTFEQLSVHICIDPNDTKFGFLAVYNPKEEDESKMTHTSMLPPDVSQDIYDMYFVPLFERLHEINEPEQDADPVSATQGSTTTISVDHAITAATSVTDECIVADEEPVKTE